MPTKRLHAQRAAARATTAAVLWSLCVVSAAAETIDGSFERAFAVDGDTLVLDVRTGSGRIAVTAGEPGRVRVSGRIRAYADRWTPDGADVVAERVRAIQADPPIELTGAVLRVGHLRSSLRRQVGVSYEVVVPANTRVRARTGSGDVCIEGVAGPVTARTGSGGTRVSDAGGDATVEAGSGSVEIVAVGGDVDVRTGSGTIRVERFGAALRARTGSGPIRAAGAPGGAWHLTSGSGGIEVDLSDEAAFELDARTRSGAVRSDHPVAVHEMRRGRLQGRVRSGGPLVTLRTGSGSIQIR